MRVNVALVDFDIDPCLLGREELKHDGRRIRWVNADAVGNSFDWTMVYRRIGGEVNCVAF